MGRTHSPKKTIKSSIQTQFPAKQRLCQFREKCEVVGDKAEDKRQKMTSLQAKVLITVALGFQERGGKIFSLFFQARKTIEQVGSLLRTF